MALEGLDRARETAGDTPSSASGRRRVRQVVLGVGVVVLVVAIAEIGLRLVMDAPVEVGTPQPHSKAWPLQGDTSFVRDGGAVQVEGNGLRSAVNSSDATVLVVMAGADWVFSSNESEISAALHGAVARGLNLPTPRFALVSCAAPDVGLRQLAPKVLSTLTPDTRALVLALGARDLVQLGTTPEGAEISSSPQESTGVRLLDFMLGRMGDRSAGTNPIVDRREHAVSELMLLLEPVLAKCQELKIGVVLVTEPFHGSSHRDHESAEAHSLAARAATTHAGLRHLQAALAGAAKRRAEEDQRMHFIDLGDWTPESGRPALAPEDRGRLFTLWNQNTGFGLSAAGRERFAAELVADLQRMRPWLAYGLRGE